MRALPQAVMRSWLPLSEAVLGMAARHLPHPAAAAPVRMPHLLGTAPGLLPPQLAQSLGPQAAAELCRNEAAIASSAADEQAPFLVYVSKMVAVPMALLPR